MSKYIDAYDLKDIEYINTGDFSTTRGIREWVDNAQPADVRENVHGEWKKIEDDYLKCSICGDISCCEGNFCSNCGADMRKGENK